MMALMAALAPARASVEKRPAWRLKCSGSIPTAANPVMMPLAAPAMPAVASPFSHSSTLFMILPMAWTERRSRFGATCAKQRPPLVGEAVGAVAGDFLAGVGGERDAGAAVDVAAVGLHGDGGRAGFFAIRRSRIASLAPPKVAGHRTWWEPGGCRKERSRIHRLFELIQHCRRWSRRRCWSRRT